MRKMKKLVTTVLVTSMVMGGSLTAFAAETDPVTDSKTGSTTGSGTSEGHVEKEVINMILPTVPEDSTPFAYTMDPERLIQETGGAKYEDYTFPAKESDTGVYFLVGEKEYANTSSVLKAINKSNCSVTLTVEVEATASAGGKDIKFATSSTPAATGDPELYLGLTVGKGTPTVVSSTKQSVTKTIAGTADNFETVYDKDNSKYVYQEKASATSWKAIEISMTGAVSKNAISADTTAPTVKVTWSYDKATEGATVDETDQIDYTTTPASVTPSITDATAAAEGEDHDYTATFTKGTDLVFTVDFGNQGAAAITSTEVGIAIDSVAANTSIVSASGSSVTIAGNSWSAAGSGSVRFCKITLDDGTAIIVKITIV